MPALHDAWTDALPAVLRLTAGRRRDMLRHELQSFLAFASMDPKKAAEMAPILRELLLQAARAARQPAAISTTRAWEVDASSMSALCHHLMANWRSAEAAAEEDGPPLDPTGMTGDIFFGPRLGGSGRPGAVRREDTEDDGSTT